MSKCLSVKDLKPSLPGHLVDLNDDLTVALVRYDQFSIRFIIAILIVIVGIIGFAVSNARNVWLEFKFDLVFALPLLLDVELGEVGSGLDQCGKASPRGVNDPAVAIEPQSLQLADSRRVCDRFEDSFEFVTVEPVLIQDQELQLSLLSEELEKQPSAVVVHEPLI